MIGKINSVVITKSKIFVETNTGRFRLPINHLVVKGKRIVGIKLLDVDGYLPISLLLLNGVKIQIDPRSPYHI